MNFSFKKSFKKKYLLLIAIFFVLFFISKNASAATRTWDGEGNTNNWSEAANWSSNVMPVSGDDVVFSSSSIKNSIWNSAGPAQIISLNVQSNYSGSLTLGRDISVSGDWTFAGSGALNAQTSTLKFVGTNYTASFTPGPASYYNVSMEIGNYSNFTVNTSVAIANNLTIKNTSGANYYSLTISSGTAITTKNLIINNPGTGFVNINTGAINVSGDVTVSSTLVSGAGSGTIVINGSTDQTFSFTEGTLPNVTINKPSGTLYLSGTIGIGGNWTWQSGNINAQTSTLKFVGTNYTASFTSGPSNYYNVSMEIGNYSTFTVNNSVVITNNLTLKNTSGANYYSLTISSGTAITTKNLIINNPGTGFVNINTGAINVSGDVTVSSTLVSGAGSGTIVINGSTDQTFSFTEGTLPNVTINKPSGTLYLSGTIGIGGNWTWQSGNINAQTSTLKFVGSNYTASFTPGPASYYNVSMEIGNYSNFTVNTSVAIANNLTIKNTSGANYYSLTISSGTAITTKNLIINNPGTGFVNINTGAINVSGDVTVSSTLVSGAGSGTIVINGSTDQTFSFTEGTLPNVTINKPSGTLYLSGTIGIGGNWTWQSGNINAQTSTLKFVGGLSYFKGGSENYYNVVIQKAPYSWYAFQQLSNINISNNLKIISGYLIQGNYNLQVNNAVIVNQDGVWQKYSTSTSYVYVGSGGVVNDGFIDFNGGNDWDCTGADSVLIRSTVNGTKRSWSGSGTFRMLDTDVKDQGGAAAIVVAQGTNSGNNGSNWTFDNNPLTYIYRSNLTSSVFDTQIISGASLNSIMFTAAGIGFGGLVKFQIASSNASSSSWSFVGPDGTSATYYNPGSSGTYYAVPINPTQHINKRYFRYKIFLETDTCRSISPQVKGVIINWSP